MAKIKPLQQSTIFSSLSDRELALFSRIVNEEDYINGTVLVAENMKSDRFYLIEKGKIALRTSEQESGEELILGQGDTIGEWSMIAPPHLTSVSARVVEEAQVLVLTRDDFDRFAEEEPAVALKIIKGLVNSLWPSLQDVGKLLKESL
jgi:CRP/FNR family cyclic AMP-dependent transcriptional regulator